MEFPGFLGNDQLKASLSAAVDRQRAAHFYLLSGPSGAGKRTLARLLAAALLCRDPHRRPCGRCGPCRKVLAGTHPDFITVDDPDRKTVSVETVRRAREDLFIRPNEGDRKIYSVPRAQDLGLPGQNALLKVLEEPPAYGVFLLLADNPDRLLPTVRSRCVELRLQPLPESILVEALEKDFPQAGREALASAAWRSGGWLGQARELLQEGAWLPQTEGFAQAFSRRDHLRLLQVLAPMEKLKREQLAPILSQWRDLLTIALTCRSGLPEPDPLGNALASSRTSRELSQGVAVLDRSLIFLQGNVSPGAVCGDLVWQLQ